MLLIIRFLLYHIPRLSVLPFGDGVLRCINRARGGGGGYIVVDEIKSDAARWRRFLLDGIDGAFLVYYGIDISFGLTQNLL